MTERTKMECIRCHGFSSARICWSCSQRPDAIDHALLEGYRKDAERYRKIKDRYSAFLVRDIERHAEGQYFLNHDLDAALDAWTEDGGGLSEWQK